jgi:hypothetical protein
VTTPTQERKSLRELRESTGTLFAKNNTATKITCNTDTVSFELEPKGYDDSIRIVPKECLNVPGFQRLWMRNAVSISDDESMENEITLLMGGQVALTPKVYTVDDKGEAIEVEPEFTEDPANRDMVFKESGDPTGRDYSLQSEYKCLVSGQTVYMTQKQIDEGEPPLHPDYASERSRIVSTPLPDGTWTHQLVQLAEAVRETTATEPEVAAEPAAAPAKTTARRSRRKTGS